jgi:hypothetical protein
MHSGAHVTVALCALLAMCAPRAAFGSTSAAAATGADVSAAAAAVEVRLKPAAYTGTLFSSS